MPYGRGSRKGFWEGLEKGKEVGSTVILIQLKHNKINR